MILHDQSLLPTAPSVPVGTTWTITEDTTWEVPATGSYQIEMHGGGGGGAQSSSTLASGGGSGEIYEQSLIKGSMIAVTIGVGGEAGPESAYGSNSGEDGGTTTFGTLSLPGGGCGRVVEEKYYSVPYAGNASGSLGEAGSAATDVYPDGPSSITGGAGNRTNPAQNYGNGGGAYYRFSSNKGAYPGTPGAVIVTYLG